MRHGPGVPLRPPGAHAGSAWEKLWSAASPPVPSRRRRRQRIYRLASSALTVGLLAASGVLLYHRYHHAPFHVTGVTIAQPAQTACQVTVLGRVGTNGAAGTVSYEWLFGSPPQAPQRGSASATASQRAVTVKAYVRGSGHGAATQTVTLRVLSPDPRTVMRVVAVRC